MVETNYQMAIDLLCCHLGLSEKEARKELGLQDNRPSDTHDQQRFATSWAELLHDD